MGAVFIDVYGLANGAEWLLARPFVMSFCGDEWNASLYDRFRGRNLPLKDIFVGISLCDGAAV